VITTATALLLRDLFRVSTTATTSLPLVFPFWAVAYGGQWRFRCFSLLGAPAEDQADVAVIEEFPDVIDDGDIAGPENADRAMWMMSGLRTHDAALAVPSCVQRALRRRPSDCLQDGR
jgi:hypothetical protein